MALTITVTDPVSPHLRAIAAQLKNPTALYKVTGTRLANDLRDHFGRLEAEQSPQHGSFSTHFWLNVRNATQNAVVDSEGATVTIAHAAFAQKVFGGTIYAKNAGALAIPILPEAHGLRPAAFEQMTGHELFAIRSGPLGKGVLGYREPGQKTFVAAYALAKSATQAPDPDALPPSKELADAVLRTAEQHLERITAG